MTNFASLMRRADGKGFVSANRRLFASLMRRADTLRRTEDDPIRSAWWAGYMRGLRRTHHGETFGTEAEHQLWLSAIEYSGPSRAALGRGYKSGLTLEAHDPD